MADEEISAKDPYERNRTDVFDSEMAYVDTGVGESTVVLLHGNPTYSYLWRNIIPHLDDRHRCLAPDLIGMGDSGPNPEGSYRLRDHQSFLDEWFEQVDPGDRVTVVGHDWGSSLGFDWARRHSDRIRALVHMEAIFLPWKWDEFPEEARQLFQRLRSEEGERMILEENIFVEEVLPSMVLRDLTEEEMEQYRRPYAEPGESRRPTLTWPREVPFEGEPRDVQQAIEQYGSWMQSTQIPKLFINTEPGIIMQGEREAYCRSFPNQEEISVEGLHYVQEDAPHRIGRAIREFLQSLG